MKLCSIIIQNQSELLEQVIQKLKAEFNPRQLYLFGSYAWGIPGPDSDLDLFIVVDESPYSSAKRAYFGHKCLRGINVPKDIIVRTQFEFDRYKTSITTLDCKIVGKENCFMNDFKDEVALSWFDKSKRDLISAKLLSEATTPILDTAIYHCQQAGEKAVKALLAFKEFEIVKTHDIGILVQQASTLDPDFSKWLDIAGMPTPYATVNRYPGVSDELFFEEVCEAIHSAESLLKFVSKNIKEIIE